MCAVITKDKRKYLHVLVRLFSGVHSHVIVKRHLGSQSLPAQLAWKFWRQVLLYVLDIHMFERELHATIFTREDLIGMLVLLVGVQLSLGVSYKITLVALVLGTSMEMLEVRLQS